MKPNNAPKNKRRNFRFLLVALALGPALATAGGYELVSGQDGQVCTAYLENLNSFNPKLPMVCERKVNPALADFTKPEWKPFSVSAATLKKIDDLLWRRDVNPAFYFFSLPEWRGTAQQRVEARRRFDIDRSRRAIIGNLTSRVDIDNDGSHDNVYLDRACGVYGALLLVLDDKQTAIHRDKTRLVMRHPSRAEEGRPDLRRLAPGEMPRADLKDFQYTVDEDALHSAYYDVFRYKGTAYFDFWWEQRSEHFARPSHDVNVLRVFQIQHRQVREMCSYRFVIDGK